MKSLPTWLSCFASYLTPIQLVLWKSLTVVRYFQPLNPRELREIQITKVILKVRTYCTSCRVSYQMTSVNKKSYERTRKIMSMIFWDRKDIFLIDFLSQGITINVEEYCDHVKLEAVLQIAGGGCSIAVSFSFRDNLDSTLRQEHTQFDKFPWERLSSVFAWFSKEPIFTIRKLWKWRRIKWVKAKPKPFSNHYEI